MFTRHVFARILFAVAIVLILTPHAQARKPIRNSFFAVYPTASGTRLDDLPSNAGHCGVCHYDFDGGGTRNWYGSAVEVARGIYGTDQEAILSVQNNDSDGDGYTNLIEITSTVFTNTPTFPGLSRPDTTKVLNVAIADIRNYLVPSGSADTTPPTVTVNSPNGGESYAAHGVPAVTWTASDASGIDHVILHHSDDGGATFRLIGVGEPNDGGFSWFVPNRPGVQNVIRVTARDNAGNYGSDQSNAVFTVTATPAGYVPTTMRDMDFPGSQPFEAGVYEDPDVNCATCHGNYSTTVEPWYNWKGSMMAQAQRDPLFLACVAVAEQDAPSVGDLCLKCHTPAGWLEGRSVDTGGGLMNAKDRQGVQCSFCHRLVDPDYKPGVSPMEDIAILDSLDAIPLANANGQFVNDPAPSRRGPYADAVASHSFLESPFHRAGEVCGTCHDVSNPVFAAGTSPGEYVPTPFDAPHPDGDLRNMFPIERTFSEWTRSQYATSGVYAPQFAGNLPGGVVSTCQDCHMRDVTGAGCSEPGAPNRTDLPLHDLTGGNHFIPDVLPGMFPGEVDPAMVAAGKQRAIAMIQLAASIALAPGQIGARPTVTVTVTNETAHKLPSGYPEGRRIWLNIKAYDSGDNLVYESGAYDLATGVLSHDADAKIYEIKPGLSTRLAPIVGLPAGPSFHFVLNDSVYNDNRIPPRGFTNAAFAAIQSPPVAYAYADSQYWDETTYVLPTNARFVEATLNYQSTSKEYIEFLRDENVTNTAGLDLYNAWVAQGRCAPVVMAYDTVSVVVNPTGADDRMTAVTALYDCFPNPFNPNTTIRYSLSDRQHVSVRVYDVSGRLVRALVDDVRPAGAQTVEWSGTDNNGAPVSSGVYFFEMRATGYRSVRKAVLLK